MDYPWESAIGSDSGVELIMQFGFLLSGRLLNLAAAVSAVYLNPWPSSERVDQEPVVIGTAGLR